MYLEQKQIIQPRYLVATKEAKSDISQELVDAVHNWGGRFLKQDFTRDTTVNHSVGKTDTDSKPFQYDTDNWYEVLNIEARKKASQTLRERIKNHKK